MAFPTHGWGKQWTKVTTIAIPKGSAKTGRLHSTWMIIWNCILKKGEFLFFRKYLEPEVKLCSCFFVGNLSSAKCWYLWIGCHKKWYINECIFISLGKSYFNNCLFETASNFMCNFIFLGNNV